MTSSQKHEPGSTYEGRALPRPHEDVVDQGLGFDLATSVGRRSVLRALGLGVGAVGLAACTGGSSSVSSPTTATATTSASGEIPDETAGPFPGDGSNGPDVLDQSGIVRSDLRRSFGDATATAEGVPMTLSLTVQNLSIGGAFAGAAVYVWHCDRDGAYSLYSDGVSDQNYLRGVQIADAQGRVEFTSIFPACYSGRWPHIHFEVYPDRASITDSGQAVSTSQVALPKDACDTVYGQTGYERSVENLSRVTLKSDNVFGDDAAVSQLGTVTGDVTTGYAVSLLVRVNPSTTPEAGGGPGGGPPPAGPGPGGPRPGTPRATPTA